QDDAAHVPVHARGEAKDIADHLDLAFAKALSYALPLVGWRVCIHVTRRYPCRLELIGDPSRMGAIDGKTECRTILAETKPCRHGVSHQNRLAHGVGKLALVVVPGNNLHPGKVG